MSHRSDSLVGRSWPNCRRGKVGGGEELIPSISYVPDRVLLSCTSSYSITLDTLRAFGPDALAPWPTFESTPCIFHAKHPQSYFIWISEYCLKNKTIQHLKIRQVMWNRTFFQYHSMWKATQELSRIVLPNTIATSHERLLSPWNMASLNWNVL